MDYYIVISKTKDNEVIPLFVTDNAEFAEKKCEELNSELFYGLSSEELGYLQDECYCNDDNFADLKSLAECMVKLAKKNHNIKLDINKIIEYLMSDDMIVEYYYENIKFIQYDS